MSGRVLHEDQYYRVVELAANFERWASPIVQQVVVVFDAGHSLATLVHPTGEGVMEFSLSFEALDVLVSSYQAYRSDRQRNREQWSQTSVDPLDDHPF